MISCLIKSPPSKALIKLNRNLNLFVTQDSKIQFPNTRILLRVFEVQKDVAKWLPVCDRKRYFRIVTIWVQVPMYIQTEYRVANVHVCMNEYLLGEIVTIIIQAYIKIYISAVGIFEC